MTKLYLAHSETQEYIGERELTKLDQNPKYKSDTHSAMDEYIYNPALSSLSEPPTAGDNQVAVLTESGWTLADDYRGVWWDTATKEAHEIINIGDMPGSDWTDIQPSSMQIWDGLAWVDDFDLWLDAVVRPERDIRLAATDKYMLSDYPIDSDALAEITTYRQELRDFPATLTEILDKDDMEWPTAPLVDE